MPHALVIYGDTRQWYAAKALKQAGWQVDLCHLGEKNAPINDREGISLYPCLSACPDAPFLLLPIPMTKDGITIVGGGEVAEVEARLHRHKNVICGNPTSHFQEAAQAHQCEMWDLLEKEEYVAENAILTAEGALGMLLTETGQSPRRLHVGIFGYGRIAQALSKRLVMLGAKVTVFARRESAQNQAKADGVFDALPFPPPCNALQNINVLYNTVPAPISYAQNLAYMPEDGIIIELASGKNILLPPHAPQRLLLGGGLPGKYMYQSAGQLIAEYVLELAKK
ncbi:MAG: hypothetical protein J6R42_04875 [Clostridia bacterium]|nr:hypothetical protein [Clostridia bacterium]